MSASSAAQRRIFEDTDSDVVIVSARRTPICKATRGGFKDTLPDDLLIAVFQAVIHDAGIKPSAIQDICVGNVSQPGAAGLVGRIAQLICGIPETVPLHGVNRFCSSGLQACANIAASIKAGYIDIGIAAGVESMTLNAMDKPPPGFTVNPAIFDCRKAAAVLIPMGITSENVAEQFGVSRERQDEFAVMSHHKAAKAQQMGLFDEEIIPVKTQLLDKDGNTSQVVISKDDGIRPDTSITALSRLRPAFKQGGSTTAGNASQVSDGAAAVILARRSFARQLDLPILGVFRDFAVVGVAPEIMGVGPAFAVPQLLRRSGLTVSDIDVFEINEAFASQAVYCADKLGLPINRLNPNGGAIALGHPLGCTGVRQLVTLLHQLKRRTHRSYGIVSMCVGTGMGAAAAIECPGFVSKL